MVSHITQPINWGDLLRDTMHLSTIAFGAYMRLIGHYWSHQGLPEDDKALARVTGLDARQWHRHRSTLQAFFHDGWKHKRIDADLAKWDKFRAAQKEKAGQRWEDDGKNPKSLKSNGPAYAAAQLSPQLSTDDERSRNNISPSCFCKTGAKSSKSLKSNGAADAGAMPTSFLYKKELNKNSGQSESPARHRNYPQARQAWEAELARKLGPAAYAEAVRYLATDQPLCERATAAEQRKPGSGVMAALLGLRAHTAKGNRP